MCAREGKPFFLLDDAPEKSSKDPPNAWLRRFEQRITLPTADAVGEDEQVAARNARIADLKLALRRGTLSLGQVVCAASPAVAAAYVACGVDWIWIEWQHSCQDAVALRAQVTAVAQRGGLSIARTAGAHDKTGIQQSLDAGVDFVLIPYINNVEEAREAIRHCSFAPRGDRVLERERAFAHQQHDRDVPVRDLGMHRCPRGNSSRAGARVLLRRSWRPCHVDGSANARFHHEIHGGGRAQWCFRYVLETCTRAGKISAAFTRDGDPSKLLAEGFSMVALSADLLDAMTGAQSIVTGDVLKSLKGWSRGPSRLIPTPWYRFSSNLPALLSHLWSVKGWRASPTLVLPNVMLADTPLLSPEQVASFRRDGFLSVPQIAPPEEVARLREIFHRLFEGNVGWERGAQYDLAGTDGDDEPRKLPQLLDPVQFAPELAATRVRANALAIAVQLLGEGTVPWFEHAILKPPGYGVATPWHQDEAHRDDPGTAYEQLSIWMPLQGATSENGCMRYIPGSHHGEVLEHHSPNDDPRITALECVGPLTPGARWCVRSRPAARSCTIAARSIPQDRTNPTARVAPTFFPFADRCDRTPHLPDMPGTPRSGRPRRSARKRGRIAEECWVARAAAPPDPWRGLSVRCADASDGRCVEAFRAQPCQKFVSRPK